MCNFLSFYAKEFRYYGVICLYPKYYFKVKMMKILGRGANSLPRNRIWLKLNIIKTDLYMLVTNKFEQDKINS